MKSVGNPKRLHWKQDPSINQRKTRGHDVCHAAMEQSMWEQNPKHPNCQKKKKSKRKRKKNFLYSFGRPNYG